MQTNNSTTNTDSSTPLWKVLNEQRIVDTTAQLRYTIMARNNLHILAEALEGWIEYFQTTPDEALSEGELFYLNKTKEALKAIS